MPDNELLLALSEMLDKKVDARLAPIENRVKRIDQKQAVVEDIALLKKVVAEHSKKLQMIS